MLAMLRRFMRLLLLILGFVLIALFVWFAGPYFAFADYHPLESARARLITIAAIIGLYGLLALIKRLRALRASDQLVAAVLKPQPQEAVQLPPDVVKLRERFEEGVATLKQHIEMSWFYDWAGGLVWLAVPPEKDASAAAIRASLPSGHATLIHADDSLRGRIAIFQPQAPALAALARRVKASFDPVGIFNPGRMEQESA